MVVPLSFPSLQRMSNISVSSRSLYAIIPMAVLYAMSSGAFVGLLLHRHYP